MKNLSDSFRLEQRLVSTRSADLYHGKRVADNAPVMLWLLRHTLAPESGSAKRFNKRMETIRGLDHPPVDLSDFGVDSSGVAYAVFPYLEGGPLAKAPYDRQQAEWLVYECTRWVAKLHAAGLVCGDLGIGSFWVFPDWQVTLVGIMGSFDVEAQSTAAAPPVETYHFVAPEQRSGAGVEAASDVYALGVLSYLIASGQYPIGDTKKILLGAPDPSSIAPLQALVQDPPAWAPVIIPRTLRGSREGRFPSAIEFLACLNEIASGGKAEEFIVSQLPVLGDVGANVAKRGARGEVLSNTSAERSLSVGGLREAPVAFPQQSMFKQSGGLPEEASTPKISLWTWGLVVLVGMVIILGGVALGVFLFFGSATPPEVEGVSKKPEGFVEPTPTIVESGLTALLSRLRRSKGPAEIQGLASQIVREFGQAGFETLVSVAAQLKVKGEAEQRVLEAGLLSVIKELHGSLVAASFKAALGSGSLNLCYASAFLLFSPDLDGLQRSSYQADCHAVAPLSTVMLVAMKALEDVDNQNWQDMFRTLAAETLRIEGSSSRSIASLVLASKDIRVALPQAKVGELVSSLNEEDLLWIFGGLDSSDYITFGIVSAEINERNIIKPPRSNFLKPFSDKVALEPPLREALLKAVGGTIDEALVDQVSLWLDERSTDLLLAICALSDSNVLHQKAFDALVGRRISVEPTSSLIKELRKRGQVNVHDYSRAICGSAFYDYLSQEEQQSIVAGFGLFVNQDALVETVIRSGATQLIRAFTESHGKNFSMHLLMELLDMPDKATRIAALIHLKWYNNLMVLQSIVDKFRKEKDEDVRQVYRDNFWVVRQSEQ